MSIKMSNISLGNIGGGPSSLRLEDLADVSVSSPQTGQYLRYNASILEWQNSFIGQDVYSFLNTNLTGSNGVSLTKIAGPNTIDIGLSLTASGDASGSVTSGVLGLTLATVNSNTGTFGSASTIPQITVDAKGRITAVTSIAISGTSPLATSLAGGSAGSLPYQSAANTTAFLSAGTTSQVLVGGPSAPSWSNTPTLTGTNFSGIPNSALNNSSLTIGSTSISLGSTVTTLSGLTSVSATTFTGALTGNASTATTLQTGRTFSLTGDASGTSGSFDGSANASISVALATVNSSPQTDQFRKVTVNGKGLVTATSAVVSSDITTALGFTPVNVAGDTMTGFLTLNADPTSALHAATKQYVDNAASGINVHQAVRAATTGPLTATYNNGTAGVGATLTGTGSLPLIDTVSLVATNRVLVKNQSNATENGIYEVTTVSPNWVLTRTSDFDNSPAGEIVAGDSTFVQEGSQATTQWVMITAGTITVGTSNIVFTQFGGPGTYTGGTGINVSGTVISNTGVTSLTAGTNVSLSASTGNVTISVTGSIPAANTAANIAGGVTGNVPYQTAANTTSFVTNAAGVLQAITSGATPTWTTTPTLTGTNFSGIPNSALTNNSITIGTTNIALGGTSTTLGGLTGVTLSSGNINFSGTTQRITGDMSNGTLSSRFGFQSNVTNGNTSISIIPNGTSQIAGFNFYQNSSDLSNSSLGQVVMVGGSEFRLASGFTGSGTALPMNLQVNNTNRISIATTGVVTFGNPDSGNHIINGGTGVITDFVSPNGIGPRLTGNSVECLLQTGYTAASVIAWGGSDVANSHFVRFRSDSTTTRVESSRNGTGTFRAMEFWTGGLQRATIGTAGNVTINAPDSGDALTVAGTTIRINSNGSLASDGTTTYLRGSALAFQNSAASSTFGTVGSGGNWTINTPTTGTTLQVENAGGNLGINVYNSGTYSALKVSHSGSGISATDGLDLVLSNADAFLINRENGSLTFRTNNLDRMVIAAGGATTFNGAVSAVSFNATSTKRVKKAIKNLSSTYLEKFSKLMPREYDRKDYNAHEFGFVAEEMLLVYPEIVAFDNEGKPSGIDYGKLSAILTAKVQEQQAIIDKLQGQISQIMDKLKGIV